MKANLIDTHLVVHRSSVQVSVKYQGHLFKKKKKKWPWRGHSCFTNTSCLRAKYMQWNLLLFQLDDDYQISRDGGHQSYLYSHYENCPQTFDGGQGAFVNGKYCQIKSHSNVDDIC